MLSGRYPTSARALDNNTFLQLEPGQAMIPTYFARNGYAMATFEKIWHPQNRGFSPDQPLPKTPQPWFTPAQRTRQQAEDPAYWNRGLDAKIADEANAELGKRATASKPFILAVGFRKPRVLLLAPKDFFDL